MSISEAGSFISMLAGWALYFDNATHTYIKETSDDVLGVFVGGAKMLALDQDNDKITMGATNWVAGTVSGGTVTEFSAANSAYAGMILGYTRIQNNDTDPGDDYITVSNSAMTVLQTVAGTNVSVQFIVPPSGNVEIEFTFIMQHQVKVLNLVYQTMLLIMN